MAKGLLAIHTGNGKGKTTAALGLVFRALGHGYKVTVIQFIKGSWKTGEQKLAQMFENQLEFYTTGQGFTWKSKDIAKDTELARKAWEVAVQAMKKGDSHLIVLDELTYLIRYNMVSEEEIIAALRSRADGVHVVVTGRHASEKLIAEADLVTEMTEIKHPYKNGVPAQKGFDF